MEHSWNCTPKWWKLLMWSFEFMLKTTLQKLSSKPVLGAPVSQWSLIVAWDDTPRLLQNWAPLKLNLTQNLLTSVRKFMTYLKHAKSSSFMVSNVDFHVPNGLGMDYEWMSMTWWGISSTYFCFTNPRLHPITIIGSPFHNSWLQGLLRLLVIVFLMNFKRYPKKIKRDLPEAKATKKNTPIFLLKTSEGETICIGVRILRWFVIAQVTGPPAPTW